MRLPQLDQVIELECGEAGQLLWHLTQLGKQVAFVLSSDGHGHVAPQVLIALPAMSRVVKRLQRLDERDQVQVGKPAKPRRFRLAFDELLAIRLYLPVTGADAVLGKVQQKSLNLETYVAFE
jgi:hypothetical protein